jgi:hypothetical protein
VNLKAVTIVVATALALGAQIGVPTPAQATTDPGWIVEMPFTGYFDRFNLAPPCCHHSDGDWSTDLYWDLNSSHLKVVPHSPRILKSFEVFKVLAVGTTCGTAGKTVKLNANVHVYNTKTDSWKSYDLGWVSYGHLANVPSNIKVGASFVDSVYVGDLHKWSYQKDCYEVSSNSGIHTHFTAYNYHNYSCYYALSGDHLRGYNTIIGEIGGNFASGRGQECP